MNKFTELVALAHGATEEGEMIDFKSAANTEKPEFWCETVKDIVSFANTLGGAIIYGLNSDASLSGEDCSSLRKIDQADLVNKIKKYTNVELSKVNIVTVERSGENLLAIIVEPVTIPIPFTKPGTYETDHGKQKNAFSVGTIYVRHGSKSEPCNRDDLRIWLEARLDEIRESWLGVSERWSRLRSIIR